MTLAVRLQELRQLSKLSQEELAEKLCISRQAVSKWESEQSNPDLDNIVKLSEIYNISTDYILKGIPVSNEKPIINAPEKNVMSKTEKIVVYGVLAIIGGIGLLAFAVQFLSIIV